MKRTLLIIIPLFLALQTFSWGDRGHKIVAQITKSCLEKSILDSVQFYLGKMSFKQASVWMDEMRSDEKYNYMRTWHYINIEKDSVYINNGEENVVSEIEKAIALLKTKRNIPKRK